VWDMGTRGAAGDRVPSFPHSIPRFPHNSQLFGYKDLAGALSGVGRTVHYGRQVRPLHLTEARRPPCAPRPVTWPGIALHPTFSKEQVMRTRQQESPDSR
jgi:hypothetical protein